MGPHHFLIYLLTPEKGRWISTSLPSYIYFKSDHF